MTILCVAGMHRSGTSLVTGWLHRSGLVIDDGDLMPGREGNEAGHFEDMDFVRIHERAILRSHPASHGWVVTEGDTSLSTADKLAVARLAWRRRRHPVWGWKDPRSVLFLDQYARLLPTMRVLVVRRARQEIVDSLVRRTETPGVAEMAKVDRSTAEALHDHCVAALDSFERKRPRRTVSMDLADIIDNDRSAFDRIDQLLGGGLTYRPLADSFDPSLLGGPDR